ncbi:thiol-disulfide oxidoreductase DCC family protein [Methylobacterium nonmethylotrophicum]|uniref:thiol-disulfide oxidoreductase DCC family protein n=1 Tax=Methylobacterium nonmethylotrophicum TaxID=1141884 RepID=UPI001436B298|nr:DCC1-like thiol-disulfide oxidoreductase family protein [Methylobacterium nonmethylotrophicum]
MSNLPPDLPHKGPILVYDGLCGLCSLLVRFVLWAERGRTRHRFAPAQSRAGSAFYAALPGHLGPDDTVLYVVDGAVLTKGRAIRALLAGLGRPWSGLARLLGWLPDRLVEAGYDGVARNRYRIGGRRDRCRPPPPGSETRFLA